MISIRKLLEGGVVEKFVQTKEKFHSTRLSSKTGSTQQVGIAFTSPIIAILIAGFLASIVVFVLEIVIPCNKGNEVKLIRTGKKKIKSKRMPYLIIVKEKRSVR